MTSEVEIVNRALARIGSTPIQSFDDPGAAGNIPERTHRAVVEDLLTKNGWSFAMKYASLSRETDTPVRGWTYAFALPSDRLGLPRAFYETSGDTRPFTRFEQTDSQVLTDAETLFAHYHYEPPVVHWPGYFRELVILCDMAELALAMREDMALRTNLRRDAYGPPDHQGMGGQFAVAATLDAQINASPEIAGGHDPVTDARYQAGDARCGYEDW